MKPNFKAELLSAYPSISIEELKQTLIRFNSITYRCNNHQNYIDVENKFSIKEFYEFLKDSDYFPRYKKERLSVCRKGDSGDYCKENCEIKTQSENCRECAFSIYKIFFENGEELIVEGLMDLYRIADFSFSKATLYRRVSAQTPILQFGIYKIIKL